MNQPKMKTKRALKKKYLKDPRSKYLKDAIRVFILNWRKRTLWKGLYCLAEIGARYIYFIISF
jgi:hypothetical protein